MLRAVAVLSLLQIAFGDVYPLVVPLKYLINPTSFFTVEQGAKLYLSGNVSPFLDNIQFSANGQNISATSLVNRYVNGTNQKDGFVLDGTKLSVTNTNPNGRTSKLIGDFYVTTAAQAQDPNFIVLDNLEESTIQSSGGRMTFVIFNAHKSGNNPAQPDYHAGFKYNAGSQKSTINMFLGVPGQDMDMFFQNPIEFTISTKKVSKLFMETEMFPVNTNYFYATTNGACSILLTPVWKNTHNFTTSLRTTTGLLSTTNDNYLNQTVNFIADVNNDGYTYIQHVGYTTAYFNMIVAKPGKRVNIGIFQSFKENGRLAQSELYSSLTFNGPANVGRFFAQYLVIEGTAN